MEKIEKIVDKIKEKEAVDPEEKDLNKQIQEAEQKLKELKKKKTEDTEDTEEEITVRPQCKMRMCENEKTGEIEIVYSKGCPKGTVERVAGRVATRGMRFRKEREDDEES